MATLVVCDYAFLFLNRLWARIPALSMAMIVVYNLLAAMAVTAQITAWCSDPGYTVRAKDQYEQGKLLDIVKNLIAFV